jgi:chemotaxis protein methyltransferase WspC
LQERYFTATPQGWQLHEAVRKLVAFSQGNLLGADFALLRGGYDVIFCRNLLIYFDDQNRERALSVLDRLLLPRGLLFVGHAESAPVLDKWFAAVASPQAFAYCKKSALPNHGKAAPGGGLGRTRAETRRETPPRQPEQPAPRLRPLPQAVSAIGKPPSAASALEQAQSLADQGRLAEAAVHCEASLREQGASAEAYYLLGLVHDAGADTENAREFFGKAVYLEPNHYEALVQLALLAERQGEVQNAAQLRQRAQRAQQRRGNK